MQSQLSLTACIVTRKRRALCVHCLTKGLEFIAFRNDKTSIKKRLKEEEIRIVNGSRSLYFGVDEESPVSKDKVISLRREHKLRFAPISVG
jgi:hypothetical protein